MALKTGDWVKITTPELHICHEIIRFEVGYLMEPRGCWDDGFKNWAVYFPTVDAWEVLGDKDLTLFVAGPAPLCDLKYNKAKIMRWCKRWLSAYREGIYAP